ncbi:uroporphyrinogen-III synthase [Sphingomonas sp. BIUV-7]|uniref:Uroporphyrinogen-III synthase n=2 Tax=Sphingomonas natans TaxID=3063330 RepID=A0ABT8Y492_9SPHN|nr:uroporphyrinogen-III synthase [Sphingomonas sp. BIUV-7]
MRGRAMGAEAIVAPLFSVEPVPWEMPDPRAHDALLLTSAHAVRHAGAGLARLAALPVYAVGAATASAAREAGLTVAITGGSDARALLAEVAAAGHVRLLHLTGADHVAAEQAGLAITRITVYRADPVAELPPAACLALEQGAITLLHSPRAAALFASLIDQAGIARASVRIAAISAAALRAAGQGWGGAASAALPTDDALLAAAARLCETGAEREGRAGA